MSATSSVVRAVVEQVQRLPEHDAHEADDAEDGAERESRSGSSRSAMRHQSRSFNSCSASARMTSDVACEPELPPELMTSGMNIASTAAFSISP